MLGTIIFSIHIYVLDNESLNKVTVENLVKMPRMFFFSSSSDGFWIPSDSVIFSKELNKEMEVDSEAHCKKFDIMDLPIDEEISKTYAQTIVVEHNKIKTCSELEPNSSTTSSFVSLFKVELLLAASAASDELLDSEGNYW